MCPGAEDPTEDFHVEREATLLRAARLPVVDLSKRDPKESPRTAAGGPKCKKRRASVHPGLSRIHKKPKPQNPQALTPHLDPGNLKRTPPPHSRF